MTFEELLQEDGRLVYRTRGVSMEPMLRQNRDLVVIEVPASRLKKYDVALYRRGTSYVLHRVIGVKRDHYLIRGDNTYALETVPDSAVLGVLTAFQRKGKKYSVTDRNRRADGLSAKGEKVFRDRPELPVLCPLLECHLSPTCPSGPRPGTCGGNRPEAGTPAAAQTPASKEK